MKEKLLRFVKAEPVLVVSGLLALASMAVVPPSAAYFSYVDFRTLGILFCLMAAVAGEFYPDAGRVSLDGRDVTFVPDHRRARQIGRLFQAPLKGTAPHMTIEENMALAYLRAARRSGVFSTIRAKDRAAFREQLAALGLGLEDRLSQPVGLLSGGQRQALTLLMATLVTPKLLLLDEHTAALDPSTAEKVLSLTEQIVALSLGNRTVMMDAGRIVLQLSGAQRAAATVESLLAQFRAQAGKSLDNDRMLLTKEK